MNKAKAEKSLRRKVSRALPCPFCGKTPLYKFRTDEKLSERGSFGHYFSREACCDVMGTGQTDLFFTNNFKKPDFKLWRNIGIRQVTEWNRRK